VGQLQASTVVTITVCHQLLEDLDAFAANVAHAHCDDGMANTRPVQLVTACVDSVEVFREVETLIDMDLELSVGLLLHACWLQHGVTATTSLLQGVVSWVGRSSIEVQAVVASNGLPALTATFLMVRVGVRAHTYPPSRDHRRASRLPRIP